VFWVANPDYLLICSVVAIVVYYTAYRLESRYRILLWLDAIGLAAFAVMGAAKGLVVTGSASVAIITGILTATFGGILRDMVSGEPSVLLRPEVYVTAALAGAAVFTFLYIARVPEPAATTVAFLIGFGVRGGALRFGWTFPPYRSRPGRRPEDIP
jgi:uncharacterized membrane protein YeiH